MSDRVNSDEIACTITWSGDISYRRHILERARAQAAQLAVKTDLKSPLFLCVNLPKAALFRSIGECMQFFDED